MFKPNKHFARKVKHILRQRYSSFWKLQLDKATATSGKLSTYKQLKQNFVCEDYITIVKNKKHRDSMSALRTSSHRLLIERGRYHTPITPRECRLCTNCDRKLIEDEKHFLIICPKYNTLRDKLLDVVNKECLVFKDMSSDNQFIYLLNSSGKVCQAVAKYCFDAMELRESS